jgi:RimJ/RimL family protein N-acetyltransferase
MEESKNNFYFTIRSNEDRRLMGFARLIWIEWTHGSGHIRLAIGSPEDRGRGLGSEALKLLLRYAFDELNLYRLTALLGTDNPRAIRFFQHAGFLEEVCRRKALLRNGQYFDIVMLGLLAEEWRTNRMGK